MLLVRSILLFISIVSALLAIPLLCLVIKNKSKNLSAKYAALICAYIAYIIAYFFLTDYFEVDRDLGEIIFIFADLAALVIYVIALIVNAVRKKRLKLLLKGPKLKKSSVYFLVTGLLPAVLLFSSVVCESFFISNADLIIETNYQNGIVISETSWIAVNEKFVQEVTMGRFAKGIGKSVRPLSAELNFDGNFADGYEVYEYHLDEWEKIDHAKAETVIKDALAHHAPANTDVNQAIVTSFPGSDYYYVELRHDDGRIAHYTSLIYKGDKFLHEASIPGIRTSYIAD